MFFTVDGTPITPGNLLSTGGMVLNKPDFAAADCVVTTTAFNPFCGTSAAAPHAAAIAALIRSASPSLSAAAIRASLTSTTMQTPAKAWNELSGAGLLDLRAAMDAGVYRGGAVSTGFVGGGVYRGMLNIYGSLIDFGSPVGGPVGPNPAADGWRFQRDGRISIRFESAFDDPMEITVEHAAAPNADGRPGKAPVTLRLNETIVVGDYDPAQHGGALGFVRQRFLVSKSALRIGNGLDNYLTIEKQGGADVTDYWIRLLRIAPKGH